MPKSTIQVTDEKLAEYVEALREAISAGFDAEADGKIYDLLYAEKKHNAAFRKFEELMLLANRHLNIDEPSCACHDLVAGHFRWLANTVEAERSTGPDMSHRLTARELGVGRAI